MNDQTCTTEGTFAKVRPVVAHETLLGVLFSGELCVALVLDRHDQCAWGTASQFRAYNRAGGGREFSRAPLG